MFVCCNAYAFLFVCVCVCACVCVRACVCGVCVHACVRVEREVTVCVRESYIMHGCCCFFLLISNAFMYLCSHMFVILSSSVFILLSLILKFEFCIGFPNSCRCSCVDLSFEQCLCHLNRCFGKWI